MSVFGRPLAWRVPRQTGRIAAGGASIVGSRGLGAGRSPGLLRNLCGALAAGLAIAVGPVSIANARPSAPVEESAAVPLARLPADAQATYRSILAGGPFPHAKDGTVFGNRERLLPREPRGHYHEYTVRTPGARDRGARRIVCGGTPPSRPSACWYTADHYASFQLIAR